MLNLAVMMPAWILGLSIFHLTMVYHRMQMAFDLISPGVIHQYLDYRLVDERIILSIDPASISSGIRLFFAQQMANNAHPYELVFVYFLSDQRTICWIHCQGVDITLRFALMGSPLQLHRHYQLLHYE